ncbi:MAG: hypothetical protein J7K96_06315, partial [Desulfobacteraceae bacterium]|nr:hypothetical protein [Desulfobacteraceae bacterium]
SNDLYLSYHEEAKDAAQQRIWTFYDAINSARRKNLYPTATDNSNHCQVTPNGKSIYCGGKIL